MPDWSYQPFFRPALFCLPTATGRNLATAGLATMQSSAPMRSVFAAMSPRFVEDPVDLLGLHFRARVGLGPGIDQRARALQLWPMLGFGFVHLGYFGGPPKPARFPVRHRRDYAITWTEDDASLTFEELATQVEHFRTAREPTAPILGWLSRTATRDDAEHIGALVDAVSVPFDRVELGAHVSRPVIARVPLDRVTAAVVGDCDGVLLVPSTDAAGTCTDSPDLTETAITAVAAMRARLGSRPLLSGAGILTPADAARTYEAGADLVQVNTGLVFSGPGLANRIEKVVANA